MNIALRPSGGRGEYELAGSQGAITTHDLFGLPIFLETVPGVAIDAVSTCELRDGKPRIRLTVQAKNAHPSALIAAAMLLPKPRRKRADANGPALISWEGFVVQLVRVDVVDATGQALLRPVSVRLENASSAKVDINYSERMARVIRIWAAAATGTTPLDEAVRDHAYAFGSALATRTQVLSAVPALWEAMGNPTGDLLPLLERHFNIAAPPSSVGTMSLEITDAEYAEAVAITPEQARVARVRQWRLANVRGAGTASFRKQVRAAYDHRCLISGVRLPPTDHNTRAGVDAAHILPWSKYDLDKPENGLCLSKQCHWAFDEGILRLRFDETSQQYVVSIPTAFKGAARRAAFDLPLFEAYEGAIPQSRLPSTRALWPSKTYLGELNRFLDGVTP